MKNTKMSKVMIAVDYDPTALKVAEVGYSMATAMNAEVILLHVISEPVYYASSEYSPITGFADYTGLAPLQMDSIEGLKEASQHFLNKTKRHLGNETIQTLIKEGDFAQSILQAAKEVHADVIVIGSHSRKWLEDIIMGSVTKEVLHQTDIPLFIVPTKKRNE